jgi:hypothetical protein
MLKLSTVDRILTILQTVTQNVAARILGVSDRTIRRWKNEGVEPTLPHRKTLVRESGRERSKFRRQAFRAGIKPADVPVQPPVRRQTRFDPRDPKRKRRILSDTVIYRAEKMRLEDMLHLLKYYRERQGRMDAVRLIHKLSVGHKDHTGRTVTRKRAIRHGSTVWEWLGQTRFQSDEGVLDWLQEVREIGKLLYLVFTIPKKRKR